MINDGGKARLVAYLFKDKPQVNVKFVHLLISLEDFFYNDKKYINVLYSESDTTVSPFRANLNPNKELDDMIYSIEFNLDKLIMVDEKGNFKGKIYEIMKDDDKDKSRLISALRKLIIDYRLDGNMSCVDI